MEKSTILIYTVFWKQDMELMAAIISSKIFSLYADTENTILYMNPYKILVKSNVIVYHKYIHIF